MRYVCTIFNYAYTWDPQEIGLGDHSKAASRVAKTVVRAHTKRKAAVRAFVSIVGRVYARKLKELNAPQVCINFFTDYWAMAEGLGCTVNRLGRCFVWANMAEGWYIRVDPTAPGPLEARASQRRRLSVRRRNFLLQALRFSSIN